MKIINVLFVALFIFSCGQNSAPEKEKNASIENEQKEKPKVEEVKNEMPVFSSFWAELFTVNTELKFKQKTLSIKRCNDYVADESLKNVTVKVLKVEKDVKGIWVATVKSNDPSFPLKWYSDEKSIWHEGMVMHFPPNPKKLSKNVDG